MGTRPRHRPEHLAAKLLAIRKRLGLSQNEIAAQIGLRVKRVSARVSEYEAGIREPDLLALLGYAKVAGVCTCVLIDDNAELTSQSHGRSRK